MFVGFWLFVAAVISAKQTDSAVTLKAEEPSWAGYKLVWSDDFNKDGQPDERNWIYEKGFVRNEELQWYQPDNARCEKGLLIIEGRRERKANPRYRPNAGGIRGANSPSTHPAD